MADFQIALAAITGIVLFVFGLENFSKEIQKITGESFRKFLAKATRIAPVGVLIGAVVTAVVQSSSATSVITISLVNAGVISFANSVSIIFGSNIGTTITAQLIAFKLTAFAPVFVILGFVLSFVRSKYSVFAKSLFYFGFVFFSLNLISTSLAPLQNDERLVSLLTQPQHPLLAILVGCLITAVVQSSSVTTGLAVIFTQQGLLSLDNAIPILMGANIGTTFTAFIAVLNMDIAAKKTALAHTLFNVGGVLLFFPLLFFFKSDHFTFISTDPAVALAGFHLIFNVATSFVFIVALKPFTRFIDKILGEGKMDFERIDLTDLMSDSTYEEIERHLIERLKKLYTFVQENYNLVTLSIETNYKTVGEASRKRLEYVDYLKAEFLSVFSKSILQRKDQRHLHNLVHIVNLYEYLFQIHDSTKDLASVRKSLVSNYIDLGSDVVSVVREISSDTLALFNTISADLNKKTGSKSVKKCSAEVQEQIDDAHEHILRLMSEPNRKDAASILHFISYSQRLRDKLLNYYRLRGDFQAVGGSAGGAT